MGCHTWFWEKTEIDYEKAYNELYERVKSDVKFYKNIVYNRKKVKKFLEYCPISIEKGRKYLEIAKRQSRVLSKGLCKEAAISQWCRRCSKEHMRHVPGKGTYVTKNGIHHHDLFRIHNYPVDKLFSLEETLKFIEDHKSEITYYHDSETETFIELLEGFWKEFPDGMIDFG